MRKLRRRGWNVLARLHSWYMMEQRFRPTHPDPPAQAAEHCATMSLMNALALASRLKVCP